jgi:hypothetical protein
LPHINIFQDNLKSDQRDHTRPFTGGRTTRDGVKDDNLQTSTRAGLTFALPVDRYNSSKICTSTGISTCTGAEFSTVGVAWQDLWGNGY